MAVVPWDQLIPRLAPFVPGAPDVTMRDALADSASCFLRDTQIWRASFDPLTTEAGVSEYELFSEASIEAVLWVKLEDRELPHTHSGIVRKSRVDDIGRPRAFWVVGDRAVRFFPTPDAAYEVSGEVALKTSRRSRGVEDWIFEAWADPLVSGAIYRLAQIPNKGWSDFELARYHKQLHDRDLANARARDFQGVNLRVQMRGV